MIARTTGGARAGGIFCHANGVRASRLHNVAALQARLALDHGPHADGDIYFRGHDLASLEAASVACIGSVARGSVGAAKSGGVQRAE